MPSPSSPHTGQLMLLISLALGACQQAPSSPTMLPNDTGNNAGSAGDSTSVAPLAVSTLQIVVSPATISLAPGASRQFTAVGTRSGVTYTVRIVWRAIGGSITSTGLYTAPSTAGSYRVIGTREGDIIADTSLVTVTGTSTGGGGSTSLANECSRARLEWIWCDDFDTDRLSRYFEYSKAGGRFTRQAGLGNGGSFAMRSVYTTAAQTGSGALHLAFGRTPQAYFRPVDAGTATYREVYWRIFVRYPSNWQGGSAW